MSDQKKQSDTGVEFVATKIPRGWRKTFIAIGSLGAFAGSFWLALNQSEKKARESEETWRPGLHEAYIAQTVRLVKLTEELQESVATLLSQNEELRGQVRDVKRQVQSVARGQGGCTEERADERHTEVMGKLDEFEKKGIKRR